MARNRVSSFFSSWSHPPHPPHSPTSPTTDTESAPRSPTKSGVLVKEKRASAAASSATGTDSPAQRYSRGNLEDLHISSASSTPDPPRGRADTARSRVSSRPSSMVQTYQPPLMEVANDTPLELQPIFTFLNSHSNKLYQEGYFLKLHDLDIKGKPSTNRTWQECFAQLVGTVLSLWDAADLDTAGDDGEVVPTFINLADASIKMIESLNMNESGGQQLQNVLSVSTAANNRYLLHFNSLNSLTQWTSGIRLSMYEHATLQEAYTGSLIAGKGKLLNNIRQILERSKFKHEDWARVRFGAGTPWRRCWFVITPPDEKEYEKAQKAQKKKNPYEKMPVLRGDLKFYETRKITKRTKPIATITNAFSAYAIYPQSKPLIDQSTLIKIEGRITTHSKQESTTDGFVFVMPEVHPAVTGFEMMLRFLFPVWDTFALYGRPSRLIADVLDQRGLMFAMPRDRRYGYLEILDVAGLIHSEGSSSWNDRQWRRQLKELTSKRMLATGDDDSVMRRKTASRSSLPGSRGNALRFGDSGRNTPQDTSPQRRAESAIGNESQHRRTASEATGFNKPYQRETRSRLSQIAPAYENDVPPHPPPHTNGSSTQLIESPGSIGRETPSPERNIPPEVAALGTKSPPPGPVNPPTFTHAPSEKPKTRPNQAPELRQGYSNLDQATLSQMAEATSAGTHNQVQASTYNSSYGRPTGRGPSPDSRSNSDYRGRNQPRLDTIPASPYIEHTSPILDRAGQMFPAPQSIPEHSMAQTAALAALHATPSYAQSSAQFNGLQKTQSYERATDPQVGRNFSVQRKPIGTRTSAEAVPQSSDPQWESEQYAVQPQGYGQNQYAQNSYGQQVVPNPPTHGGQMPYRSAPQQAPYDAQYANQNGQGGSNGNQWM